MPATLVVFNIADVGVFDLREVMPLAQAPDTLA